LLGKSIPVPLSWSENKQMKSFTFIYPEIHLHYQPQKMNNLWQICTKC